MSSFFKFAGFALLALILLIVAAAAIFIVTFDPNDLKAQIVEAVREETGRELTIEGDIDLSLFPYLGFSLGATRLGDAPGFGEEPFLAFDGAGAHVRVLPLLSGRIEVGELRLEGFALKAVTAADGRNNWDDLKALGEAEDEAAAPPAGQGDDAASAGADLDSLTIGSIVFRDARLSYEDRAQNIRYAITDWNLQTGRVQLGEPVDIDTGLDFSATEPPVTGHVEARGRLTPGDRRTTLADPLVTLSLTGAAMEGFSGLDLEVKAADLWLEPAGPFALTAPTINVHAEGDAFVEPLDARIAAESLTGDLTAETLELSALEARALGLRVTGEVTGTAILSGVRLAGNVKIDEFSPKAVAERAGTPLGATADPQALTRAALSGNFASGPDSIRFQDVVFELDDTTFRGDLAVVDLEKQALRFDLSADQLTLDRYMAPASDVPEAPAGTEDDVAIPVDQLRTLDIDGKLAIDRLALGGLQATNARVTLKAADGVLRIHPARADMYGGTYEGDIRIDASGELPRLSLNERLSGIDFGALSVDVFDTRQLTGAFDGRVTLSGVGATQSAIKSTLAGDAEFAFLDGAFLGVDIPYELRRGLALIGRGSPPAGASSGRTQFAELSGTAQAAQGVLRNDDLIVRLPFIYGTGKGTVDLTDDTLRYRLDLAFQKTPELPTEASEFVGITFPVVLEGTLGEPALDMGDMAAALARKRVEKEVDKVKDRILDEAGDVLGGFLGGGKDKQGAGEPPAEGEPGEAGADETDEDTLGGVLRRLRRTSDNDDSQ